MLPSPQGWRDEVSKCQQKDAERCAQGTASPPCRSAMRMVVVMEVEKVGAEGEVAEAGEVTGEDEHSERDTLKLLCFYSIWKRATQPSAWCGGRELTPENSDTLFLTVSLQAFWLQGQREGSGTQGRRYAPPVYVTFQGCTPIPPTPRSLCV